VLVTRAPDQSADFVRLLEEQGAHVAWVPLIRIGPAPDERALQEAADNVNVYDWLVFTSAAGVEAFAQRVGRPLKENLRVAVVGPATAQALVDRLGVQAKVMPAQYSSSALADAINRHAKTPQSILLIAAEDASPVLAAKLRNAGHRVDKVDAYTTVQAPPADLEEHVNKADVITLASPSAVRALVDGLGGDTAIAKLRGKLLACIGPVTLFEARERGLHVEIVPEAATIPALIDALCRYYTTQHS
jgi:uroporphyrinogen III methyltransferase/synthase